MRRSAVVVIAAVVGSVLLGAAPADAVPTGEYETQGVLRITAQPGDRRMRVEVSPDLPLSDSGPTTYVRGRVDLGDDCFLLPDGPRQYACRGKPSLVVLDGGPARVHFLVSGDVTPPARLVSGRRGGWMMSDGPQARFIGRGGRDVAVWEPYDYGRLSLVVRLHGGDDRFELSSVHQAVHGPHGPGPARVLLGAGDDGFALDVEPGTELVVVGGTGNDQISLARRQTGRGGPGADTLRRGVHLVGGRGEDVLTGGSFTRLVDAVDGDRDVVTCASDKTVVRADRIDDVSASCVHVLR
ncbi:hypothetical protein ISU07_04840 [Nocardioides islandensis]|uniref:Calcium-binding protein n=1 Tax=Nocardioides islandensis TaxID=433663 RepID=A0A930VD65_9ACTN|nr:hypothetical protein [Nocardioides islandensis]MBF4762442.1 hypothetical protein [Nocardioides islandensis]